MNYRNTLKVNEKGHLEIGGVDCTELAKNFGTPLYALDEKHIRDMCRVYKNTLEKE
jgi:diaminopimelate decarboxylase